MAAKMTMTTDAHSGRILAGTLLTAKTTMRCVIVTSLGAGIKIEPFEGETHSTSFVSRAALIKGSLAEAVKRIELQPAASIEQQRLALEPYLASAGEADAALVIIDR